MKYALVGAGSVITKNIKDYACSYNPGRQRLRVNLVTG